MDHEWAGIALYHLVADAAAVVFKGKYRPGRDPHGGTVMGGKPPSYDFTSVELKRFGKDVASAVGARLGLELAEPAGLKIKESYGETVLGIWVDLANQIDAPADVKLARAFQS